MHSWGARRAREAREAEAAENEREVRRRRCAWAVGAETSIREVYAVSGQYTYTGGVAPSVLKWIGGAGRDLHVVSR